MEQLANLYVYDFMGRFVAYDDNTFVRTDIKEQDLPEHYLQGKYAKRFGEEELEGFLNFKGIKSVVYRPESRPQGFSLGMLFLSYDELNLLWGDSFWSGGDYFCLVRGEQILRCLNAIDRFSPECNTSKAKEALLQNLRDYEKHLRKEWRIKKTAKGGQCNAKTCQSIY